MRKIPVVLVVLILASCTTRRQPPIPPPPASVPQAPEVSLLPRTADIPEWTPVVHQMSARPMALTASDGSALRLVEVMSQTVVEDPLAFTELKLTFENPQKRRVEGRFEITLPAGAAVSRFAMRIADKWQEGEVVERAKSQRAYEDFLHRGIDPALLEHAGGNRFSARVFPIESNERKELIISYSQELGENPVLVPLQGLPAVDRLDVSLSAAGSATPVQWLKRTSYTPEGDFGLDGRLRRRGPGLRSGELVLARVRPKLASSHDGRRDLFFLVDTSASRAIDFDGQLATLAALVLRLTSDNPHMRFAVGCFDQTQEVVFEGRARDFSGAALMAIRARAALGASDLPAALRWAGAQAKRLSLSRVVLFGDGVTTAGGYRDDAVHNATAALASHGVTRIDVVAVGGLRDTEALRRIATGLPSPTFARR